MMVLDNKELSRRERQILDILFTLGEGTVKQIQEKLTSPPTEMAIRRMLKIMEEKDLLKRRNEGRAVVYAPRQSKKRAGTKALRHVLDTFFGGALEEALAAHFSTKKEIPKKELQRLKDLIQQAAENK